MVPVAKGCPVPAFRAVDRPETLAVSLITEETQMDKDVDYLKATIYELLAYATGLETAVKDRDAVLKACSDVG